MQSTLRPFSRRLPFQPFFALNCDYVRYFLLGKSGTGILVNRCLTTSLCWPFFCSPRRCSSIRKMPKTSSLLFHFHKISSIFNSPEVTSNWSRTRTLLRAEIQAGCCRCIPTRQNCPDSQRHLCPDRWLGCAKSQWFLNASTGGRHRAPPAKRGFLIMINYVLLKLQGWTMMACLNNVVVWQCKRLESLVARKCLRT